MRLCRFSLAGSLKSDFAPSFAGTTHASARRSRAGRGGAGVPPYRVCRAIWVTNGPHVGEKSHAHACVCVRTRPLVCPWGALPKVSFAMCLESFFFCARAKARVA